MKVSVAVRQKFHGFQLAQQLEIHKCLHKLYTAFYGSILGRDNSSGYNINPKNIKTNFFNAFRTYVLNDHSFENDDRFGRWVASQIKDEEVIVTWGIQALPILERTKSLGIKVVLERGSAHASEQKEILLDEYRSLGLDTGHLEKSFSEQRMERELLEYDLADVVSIPSSFVKRSFLKYGFSEQKLFVNHFGADLKAFQYAPVKHSPFRFIYTGTLSIRKGVHYLLQAFYELSIPETELWLVGKTEEEIKPFINKYHSQQVKLFDPVPQHELSAFYNQCDVFVICSIEEGMAMVQPQAMACGIPLICTTNTGGDDLIENGKEGFVIPIKNVEALKERISFYSNRMDIANEHGINAYKKIHSGFTWQSYGERANALYKKIINPQEIHSKQKLKE
ncbi:MAG: glycosyltransferase family 4 protein [Chitinophagaceae bacterium]|nr:glycosyltransferase family 4 protein [Chitinophagaceae bacterium]